MAVGTVTTENSGTLMTTFNCEAGTSGGQTTYNVYRVSTTKDAKRVTMISVSVVRASEPSNAYTEANIKHLHDAVANAVKAHIDGNVGSGGAASSNPAF